MTTLLPDDTEQSKIFETSSETCASEDAFEDLLKRMGKITSFPTEEELPQRYTEVRDEVLKAVRSIQMVHTALKTGGAQDRAGWNFRPLCDPLDLSVDRY